MKKILGFAGAIALSIIPTPSFSGEVEQKEMMSVTEQLLPQIGEKYKNLDIKEKKAYKEALINYLEYVKKTGVSGVSEGLSASPHDDWWPVWEGSNRITCASMHCTHPNGWPPRPVPVPDEEMWLWSN